MIKMMMFLKPELFSGLGGLQCRGVESCQESRGQFSRVRRALNSILTLNRNYQTHLCESAGIANLP